MPPCMTTSVWPSDAIASAAANGSIVRSVPLVRLDGANRRLAANSPTVATIDGREAARQQAPRPPRDGVLRLRRPAHLRSRRHVGRRY